jgi:hypothetical protein
MPIFRILKKKFRGQIQYQNARIKAFDSPLTSINTFMNT